MKKKVCGFVSILLAFGIAAFSISCSSPTGSIGPSGSSQTPVSGDYTAGNLSQTAGSVTAVTITARSGKSPGAISNIKYNNSTTIPQTAGTYPVTFDVAAASGWNAAAGLSAGTLVVVSTGGNTAVTFSSVTANGSSSQTTTQLTLTFSQAIAGLSIGDITLSGVAGVSKGTLGGSGPTYTLGISGFTSGGTLSVAVAKTGYTISSSSKTVTIYYSGSSGGGGGNQIPAAGDYTFGNLNQMAGSVTAVTVTAKSGRSPGAISNIRYAGNSPPPQTAGTYAVTFDVAAVTGWNAALGLSAGDLVVNPSSGGGPQTPLAGDFTFGNLNQTAESVTAVTITPRSGKSTGAITVYYAGTGYPKSKAPPRAVGTYEVTFDVAAVPGWRAVEGLPAGNLIVAKQTPVASDYTFGNLNQMAELDPADNVTKVDITPKSGKSGGQITIYYTGTVGTTYARSPTPPQTVGTYAVTFDVAEYTGWYAATGLSAGNLIVTYPFTFTDNGSTITITGYIGTRSKITIPNTIYGRDVTAIGNRAFRGKQLTGVEIPKKVTSIGNEAFYSNRLTGVTIPSGVTFIGSEAFYNNQLGSVNIPNSVTSILPYAFSHNLLTSVTIPNTVTTIVYGAFSHNLLAGVTIPTSVRTIESEAFSDNRLISVTIPNGVTTIEKHAFSDNLLASVTFGSRVTTIEYGAFRFNKLTSVTIPPSVRDIGEFAFSGNQLASITIGANVTIENSEALPPGFFNAYNNSINNRQAGTYTLSPNGVWTGP